MESPVLAPKLKPYGKAVWVETLKMLDAESLSPSDYILVEALCHCAEQLRETNAYVQKNPFVFVGGMCRVNQMSWSAQALVKSIALITDKLGINRAMRKKEGLDAIPEDLVKFLRGDTDEEASDGDTRQPARIALPA